MLVVRFGATMPLSLCVVICLPTVSTSRCPMLNLPPDLLARLRRTLLDCGPFTSHAELSALFIDARIGRWRDGLPDARDATNRVNLVIDFLLRQSNETLDNALVLLLNVLAEQESAGDMCSRRLLVLAEDLAKLLADPSPRLNTCRSDRRASDGMGIGRRDVVEIAAPAVPRPVNMSFEGLAEYGRPSGWFNSKGFVAGVSTSYRYVVVPRGSISGEYCVRMENLQANPEQFGSLMQRCLVHSYLAGKAIRLQAEARTENLDRWAGIWVRADPADGPELFFDNMSNRPIQGTTDWTRYSIDAVLPPETVWLNYGIVLVGRGTMWVDNFRLWVWSSAEGRWEQV